jgi:hypothetical protein
VRKTWHQIRRAGFDVARCMVARQMKDIDLQGIIRGKPHRMTIPDKTLPCPPQYLPRAIVPETRVPIPATRRRETLFWALSFRAIASFVLGRGETFEHLRVSAALRVGKRGNRNHQRLRPGSEQTRYGPLARSNFL